jgi:GR25 family glycosyltransferase involved in LPS biosynthesis
MYIINVPWQHYRLHHAIQQCNTIGIHGVPIKAVEKRTMIPMQVSREFYNLKKTEVAVYQSHIKALTKVSQEPDGYYIIAEDDFILCKNFREEMNQIHRELKSLPKWDILFLGFKPYSQDSLIKIHGTSLCYTGLGTGTWCYMLRPSTAWKIVSELRNRVITHPIDLVLTVPYPPHVDNKTHSKILQGMIKLCVQRDLGNKRIGIVDELSTYHWGSTSSVN